jgi:hypothetical protein
MITSLKGQVDSIQCKINKKTRQIAGFLCFSGYEKYQTVAAFVSFLETMSSLTLDFFPIFVRI